MSEKCTKYESLFLFSSEADLEKHLEECEDCRIEHEKMQKTASLVKEAKPHYRKKAANARLLKIAAGLTVLFLAYFSVSTTFNNDIHEVDLSCLEGESVINEMGLPTDEYGLLMVY